VTPQKTHGVGQAVFVAHTSDAGRLYDQVQSGNLEITQELFSREVPKTGNKGKTEMKSMGFKDTEGFVWEVNQRTE
jgi:hypothetical protein